MSSLISPFVIDGAYSQEATPAGGAPADVAAPAEAPAHVEDGPAAVMHEGAEAHAAEGHHGGFPPFDPATFGPQLLWLAITFGALYLLMSRVALPRVGSILEERSNRIGRDLAEAARAKESSDAAVAAYEQALATARANAHQIAQKARDASKASTEAERKTTEAALNQRLAASEADVSRVKAAALAEVDAIARDAVETMVEVLVGKSVDKAAVARAVDAALAERA